MQRRVTAAILALLASGVFAQTSITPSGGGSGGPVTITSGSTATSGCVAGGVLRSISNMVDCGAGLTYASGNLSIGVTGGTHPLSVQAGSNVGIMLLNAAQTYTLATIIPRGSVAPNTNKGYFTLHDSGTTPVVIDSAGSSYFEGGNTRFGGSSLGSTVVPLTARLGTGSTANVFEMQNSAGTVLSYFNSAGNLNVPSTVNLGVSGDGIYGSSYVTALKVGPLGHAFSCQSNANPTGCAVLNSLYLGWTSASGSVADTFFTRAAAATVQMGATITSGSAVNQTFRSHNATTGTDISGGNLTITAPGGTGSSTGGTIAFQTAPVLASGTTAQTPVDRLTIPKTGGIQLVTASTKPSCDSAARGQLFYVAGGAGVADTYEVCVKSAGDTYSWTAIF